MTLALRCRLSHQEESISSVARLEWHVLFVFGADALEEIGVREGHPIGGVPT